MEKTKLQSYTPFDPADFFGYLFPGLMAVLYVTLFEYLTFESSQAHFLKVISFVGALPWFLGLVVTIAFTLIIYVIGHLIGAISSIVFDRVLMEGIYGYPVVHLLKFERIKRSYSEATHRYLFVSFNLFILFAILIGNDTFFQYSTIGLAALVVLLLIARVWIKTVKVSKNAKHVTFLTRIAENRFVRKFFLTPSLKLEWIEEHLVKALLGVDRPFPTEFRERYKLLFRKVYRMNPEEMESENYWLSYLYAVNQNPQFVPLLKTWLHLYGFARNVATATFIGLFGFAVLRFFEAYELNTKNQVLFGAMFFTAWVFTMRYWVLYQGYHTKNVLRAFVATAGAEERSVKSSKSNRKG